jgi:DNA mismatch endonuclease (patch repair protein)
MSLIRSRGNKATELELARIFRANGITGWRRNKKLRILVRGSSSLLRPDFVFAGCKVAVFVDGAFWHGHPTRAKIPKTRRAWWLAKIEGNKARDRRQNRLLRKHGWTVVRIWQHELERKHLHRALRKLRAAGLLDC